MTDKLLNDKKKVIVLGAGVGGLSVGYFLAQTGKFDVTVLEKDPVVGGLCASFEHDGFVLDYGAHKFYSVIPGILDEFQELMQGRLLKVEKKHRLFLRGRFVDYPLRLGNLARVLGIAVFLRIGLGYAWSIIQNLLKKNRDPRSYEEYMLSRFGRPGYELVFEPLADKVWGRPSELHTEMARTRVPVSGGMEVILKLLGIKKETAETNAEYFYYPRKGFGDFPQALREKIESLGGRVVTNANVDAIQKEDGKIRSVTAKTNGQSTIFPCDYVVSSILLTDLSNLLLPAADSEFKNAVCNLQFRHMVIVYLFVTRPSVLEDHWIFFPERKYLFSRIFEQKCMNPDLGPPDKTVLCCDFTCEEDSWGWKAGDDEVAERCVEDLVAGGFIKANEVTGHLVVRRRSFYPRYDLDYMEKLRVVYAGLKAFPNLLLTGRIGMYNYNNADHCLDMGRFISEKLAQEQAPSEIWENLADRVASYRIVD